MNYVIKADLLQRRLIPPCPKAMIDGNSSKRNGLLVMTDRPYGEVLDEMDHEAKYQHAAERQQLVARIKRSSKYYGQSAPGEWFDVHVVNDRSYPLRGNENNYRMYCGRRAPPEPPHGSAGGASHFQGLHG
jgi:hypothetical protein